MKNLTILGIVITLFFSCEKQINSSEKKFHLAGFSANNENKRVLLKVQEHDYLKIIDSTYIKNGAFNFQGHIEIPIIYGIYIDGLEGVVGIFMENDSISVAINDQNLEKSKISGSKTNNEYLKFIAGSNQIVSKMNTLFPTFQKARAENNIERLREINLKMDQINLENMHFALKYAIANPDSYIAAYALNTVLSSPHVSKDSLRTIYDKFSEYVKKGDFATQTLHYLNE